MAVGERKDPDNIKDFLKTRAKENTRIIAGIKEEIDKGSWY
jgi:hypothetical protein